MQAWNSAPVPRLQPPVVASSPEASSGRTPSAITSAPPRLRLFDSAQQTLVAAGPASGTARMYVCGITPYDATHMGHANTYVSFDLLNRVWRDAGLDVHYVQNVTDVDDPLLERATATGVDWTELAASQIELFREDMTALRVLPPREYVGAVEAIPQIVELIADLQARGAVYVVDDPEFGDLYFDQTHDAAFGSLSHLSAADAASVFAERGGDPDRPGKRGPLDCLVWRQQRTGEPGWDSPFGVGRPGWHIECTAIALQLLGTDFDVQGGGSDLVFPHHEMCAGGARAATGEPFAQVFAHSGMVGLDGEKMSKSRGNLVLVSKLRASGVDPMAVRLALLSHHYRSDWTWTDELLRSAGARLDRWREAVRRDAAPSADEVLVQVRAALAADLDAPTAVAAVDAWARSSTSGQGDDPHAPAQVAALCDALLGIAL